MSAAGVTAMLLSAGLLGVVAILYGWSLVHLAGRSDRQADKLWNHRSGSSPHRLPHRSAWQSLRVVDTGKARRAESERS